MALVVAVLGSTPLGEAAYHAAVPKNSVGTAQLRKDAVTAAKVTDGSLLARDFKPSQIPAGPPGPQGPVGSKGDKGGRGEPATTIWARFNADGTGFSKGATRVSYIGSGTYQLTFQRDVSRRAILVTPNSDAFPPVTGFLRSPRGLIPDEVWVTIVEVDRPDIRAPRAFDLAVLC